MEQKVNEHKNILKKHAWTTIFFITIVSYVERFGADQIFKMKSSKIAWLKHTE